MMSWRSVAFAVAVACAFAMAVAVADALRWRVTTSFPPNMRTPTATTPPTTAGTRQPPPEGFATAEGGVVACQFVVAEGACWLWEGWAAMPVVGSDAIWPVWRRYPHSGQNLVSLSWGNVWPHDVQIMLF